MSSGDTEGEFNLFYNFLEKNLSFYSGRTKKNQQPWKVK